MKTVIILFILGLFSSAFPQWQKTNLPDTLLAKSFAVSGTNVFAGTLHGVYLSTNNGNSWTKPGNNNLMNPQVHALCLSGPNLVAGTWGSVLGSVFYSPNNGTDWVPANGLSDNPEIMSFCTSGPNLFAGTNSGVYLSTNNGTAWTHQANIGEIISLYASGPNLLAGGDGGLSLSTDNGTNWKTVNLGGSYNGGYVTSFCVSGTNLFAGFFNSGTVGGGILVSTNNGTSWKDLNIGPNVYSLCAIGQNIFAGTDHGVIVSPNKGYSWIYPNTGDLIPTNDISSLSISGPNLIAGTSYYFNIGPSDTWIRPLSEMITGTVLDGSLDSSAIKVSSNNGLDLYANWNGTDLYVATQSAPSVNEDVFIFVTDSLKSLFAAPWAKVGKVANWSAFLANESTNNYNGWTGATGTAQSNSGSYLEGTLNLQSQFGYIPNKIYICAARYSTDDAGQLITQAPAGNGDGNIDAGEFFAYNYTVQGIDLADLMPSKVELIQNYPNPFNPSTTIEYRVAQQSEVTLKVYDMLGREVSVLVNEVKSPGYYKVTFDASHLASGIYFYSLRSGNSMTQKKMMLIK
jgi:hypothetical protein